MIAVIRNASYPSSCHICIRRTGIERIVTNWYLRILHFWVCKSFCPVGDVLNFHSARWLDLCRSLWSRRERVHDEILIISNVSVSPHTMHRKSRAVSFTRSLTQCRMLLLGIIVFIAVLAQKFIETFESPDSKFLWVHIFGHLPDVLHDLRVTE